MKHKVGDKVYIHQFRKQGLIISGPSGKGLYAVAIDNFTIHVPEHLLGAAKDEPLVNASWPQKYSIAEKPSRVSEITIDLHGLTIAEALERTTHAIDRALLSGISTLIVNHGKGEGKLRTAIHQHLNTLHQIKSFNLSPLNPGLTLVHL